MLCTSGTQSGLWEPLELQVYGQNQENGQNKEDGQEEAALALATKTSAAPAATSSTAQKPVQDQLPEPEEEEQEPEKRKAASGQRSFTEDGGVYTFEAEEYYDRTTAEGQAADLQPHTQIELPLSQFTGFPEGMYKVEVMYAGNGQTLDLSGGGSTLQVECPDVGFDWNGRRVAYGGMLNLSAQDSLTIAAVTDGKYGWVDWVRLTPVKEMLYLAKDYVEPADKITGGGTCANMDPGVKLVMTMDNNFSGGAYEIRLRTCGNARTYQVKINGVEQDGYETTGSDFGTAGLHDESWQGRYVLNQGDKLEIIAPDGSYGWIESISFNELPVSFYQKDEETGIKLEAGEGVLPRGTQVRIHQIQDKESDTWFEEFTIPLRAVYFTINLILPGSRKARAAAQAEEEADGSLGEIWLEIPVPAGMDAEADELELYYIGEDGPESLSAVLTENKKALQTTFEGNGVYAVTAAKGTYHYEAERYYSNLADDGKAANFETGNGSRISIDLKKTDGFVTETYNLLARYCGGGDKDIRVLVNGRNVGNLQVPYSDWGSYQTGAASAVLSLKPGDLLELEVPEGQYHWLDYLELKQAEPFFMEADGIQVSAPVGTIPYGGQLIIEDASSGEEAERLAERVRGAEDIQLFRLRFYLGEDVENAFSPRGALEIRITLPEDFNQDKFCLYSISGQGQGMRCSKRSCQLEDGEVVFTVTDVDCVFALVNGAASLPLQYDGYGIYQRSGAKSRSENHSDFPVQSRTRMEGKSYIYEGEAYYKGLENLPAADLQPGAQLNIPLSQNPNFNGGVYQVVVRSNGNRQLFLVKVNDQQVGTISRQGTNFTMAEMTDDAMVGSVALNRSDVLTIEGEGGGNYGWVDYVMLKPEGADQEMKEIVVTPPPSQKKSPLHYPAAGYYEKKTEEGAYADLQPGDSITIRVGDQSGFMEGWYRIAVSSNGNRTRLLVKKNEEVLGSIVRVAGTGFDSSDFTRDVLDRSIYLQPEDRITIEAAGSAQDGPWGWVKELELILPPEATGEAKTEFRYDGEDYYPASLYSPAADLQAGESIHFVLSDDPDFTAGRYRLSVLSNGTREQFIVSVNGAPVGEIRKERADYSDIDYSQDYLEGALTLAPGDILTITGQDGDHFGWVNYILLEKEE